MRFSAATATVLACLLPIVAISVLSSITKKDDMLLVMAGFTAVFATGLMFVTDGSVRRVDIFTATAAFAAVMVVFVQGQVEEDNQKS
ncbi:hypothetical protein PVAG01_07472 [Phlyctema vagabunda]|uniref:DUF6594 domain-containing protein n=1 Tax=Phlyctema vagabunda TaxID=108571 RepID=A0ABR4PCZ0_9HELO